MILNKLTKILAVAGVALLCGCGSGGGSSDSSGAADLHIEAHPTNLDVGDRVRIDLQVSRVHESGIVLKVRFPDELSYVGDTAEFQVGVDDRSFPPATVDTIDGQTFMLFRIKESDAGEDNEGTLSFELRANGPKSEATIAADPDVDYTTPFDLNSPEFESSVETTIEIAG